ncbi:MAG: T9SS type A sorting domain-containing protein, partial [Bacteroidota bacterium]
ILSESTYDYDRSAERYQPITKELWVYPLGEAASQNDFLLYPQPSQGEITIQLVRQSSPPQQIRVYDLSGCLILSQVVQLAAHENRIEFALKQLPGLYTVQLEYEDGSSLSRKLLLE